MRFWTHVRRWGVTLAFAILLQFGAAARSETTNEGWKHLGVWLRPHASESSATKQLDDIASAGFSDVFLETFYHGFVIYPSSVAPQRPEMKGKDYLALYIKEARKRGLRVHAWLETFYWEVDTKLYPQFPRTPLFQKHPEWQLLLRDGSPTGKVEHAHNFANPAHPQVRGFVADLIAEIVKNYDVAGVNLDYVRYPDGREDAGYDPFTRKLYRKRFGIDPINIERVTTSAQWRQWVWFREAQVLEMVRLARDRVDRAGRKVILSAAIFPNPESARYESPKFQNWREMLRRGYLDAIVPMAYAPTLSGVESEIKNVLNALPPMSKAHVWPALAVQKRTTDIYAGVGHPPIAKQANIIKGLDLNGFSIFCYDWIIDSEEGLGLLDPLGVKPQQRKSIVRGEK